MIELKASGHIGGDETRSYDVVTDWKTIGGFVSEVLTKYTREWGTFRTRFGNFDYKYGKMVDVIPPTILAQRFSNVKASGGWSNMDYKFY